VQTLAAIPEVVEVPPLSSEANAVLERLVLEVDESFASEVKAFEATTNHDVKAVEYALKRRAAGRAAALRYASERAAAQAPRRLRGAGSCLRVRALRLHQ